MPPDKIPRINVGDGSIIHSKERIGPGVEVVVIFCGESDLKLYDSVELIHPDTKANFFSVVTRRDVYALADVPEKDVKAVGFLDLYYLAESLRHRHLELTWHDQVTVLQLIVYEGYWE